MSRPDSLAVVLLLTAAPAAAQPRASARVVGPADGPAGLLRATRLAALSRDTLVAGDRGSPRGA